MRTESQRVRVGTAVPTVRNTDGIHCVQQGESIVRRQLVLSYSVMVSILLLVSGCGGSSSSGAGSFTTSLSGNWAGAWKNNEFGLGSQNQGVKNEGLVRAQLQEDDTGNVSGTATWTGFACFLNATVTGVVSGSAVSLTFVDGEVRVTFNGQRKSDSHIDGGWDNDAGCFGQGELKLDRG